MTYFQAVKTSQQVNVTGSGQLATAVYNTETADVLNEYSPVTGEFTASSDGWRAFTATMIIGGVTSQHSQYGSLSFLHIAAGSGFQRRYYWHAASFAAIKQSNGSLALNGSVIIPMGLGDKLMVQCLVSGPDAKQTVSLGADPGIMFSGVSV